MLESAKSINSVIEIPELVYIITQRLSPWEIANVATTCKSFYNQFSPFLWKNVIFKHSLMDPSFFRNIVPHVQTLQFFRLSNFSPSDVARLLSSFQLATDTDSTLKTLPSPPPGLFKDQGVLDNIRKFRASVSSGEDNDPFRVNGEESDDNDDEDEEIEGNETEEEDAKGDNQNKFDVVSEVIHTAMVRFLSHCLNLTDLELPVFTLMTPLLQVSESRDSFFRSVPQLERLKLTGTLFTPIYIPTLFKSCFQIPQLKSLDFGFNIGLYAHYNDPKISNEEFNSILESIAKTTTSPTKLTSLRLPDYKTGYPSAFLIQLFRQYIPNLERFEVPQINENDTDEDLAEGLSGSLSKLEHLECKHFEKDAHDESATKAFIKASGGGVGIKTFKSHYFDDKDYFLKSREVMQTLVSIHHKTLEEIHHLWCEAIISSDIKDIFSTCRRLTRYWTVPFDGAEVAIRFDDVANGDWVCRDLKELYLTLNRRGEDTDIPNNSRDMTKRVYTQIGKLTKLETLKLACDKSWGAEANQKDFENDLLLKSGHLAELGGLVNLRHFFMGTDFWYMMGQEEVEFIHSHWLKLEKITFRSQNFYSPQDPLQDEHWQWLKNQRPNISLVTV